MTDIDEMKEIELQMLVEIDKICRENDIKYSLVCGSLLGAVRHKGFIPWDDDIDVGMTPENYNKFLRIAKDKLPKELIIENTFTYEECPHFFTKIINTNTTFIDELTQKLSTPKGLGLDIFPLYGMPEKEFKNSIIMKKIETFLLSNYYSNVDLYDSRLWVRILRKLTHRIRVKTIVRVYIRWMEKQDKKAREINCLDNKCRYGVFEKYIELPFEGHYFMAIQEYDEYLRSVYGDYMTPPPKDKRGSLHKYLYWNPNKSYSNYLKEMDNNN